LHEGVRRDTAVSDIENAVENDQGNRTPPAYVAWKKQEQFFGDAAKNQVASNPTNVVFDAKRFIATQFAGPVVQAPTVLAQVPKVKEA